MLIAIRELAYFVYQSGNLTLENGFNSDALEGTNLHSLRQAEYGEESVKEYYITKEITYQNRKIKLHGYVDGLLQQKKSLVLEEIKTTAKDIYHKDFQVAQEHLAQLKIYGYLLMLEKEFTECELNLLYIERKTYIRRNFKYHFNLEDLQKFLDDTLTIYFGYLDFFNSGSEKRIATTKDLEFPFKNIRLGQELMMQEVFKNFEHQGILYVLAPTGIGKTMATIFSGLKAMQKPKDKLFYLTAKNSGKKAALKATELLLKQGLQAHVLELTAKSKSCLLNLERCNPEDCPYAKDFFGKLNEATKEILSDNYLITQDKIIKYSLKHEICSFEYSLNISLYADIIIADYNYVFDPKVKLIRFFETDTYKPYILVDEAHNLASRSLNMYSAKLNLVNLLYLRKLLFEENVSKKIAKLISYLHKTYDSEVGINQPFISANYDQELYDSLVTISENIFELLENNREHSAKDKILEQYFIIKDFIRISDLYSKEHLFIIELVNDNLEFTLYCRDASKFLNQIIYRHTSGVCYFSATLYPSFYYQSLLSNNVGDLLALDSPFDPERLKINIAKVSTRYKDRLNTLSEVIALIKVAVTAKFGRYIAFFPSYQYLNMAREYLDIPGYKLIVQEPGVNNQAILEEFQENDRVLGLFVLGGIYSEGIDFIGELLHGVIIVGVGLPQIGLECDILKNYFDNLNGNGYDYAYTYPGITKIVQASGRVIRTETDRGILLLIDDRYLYKTYQELLPKHWHNRQVIKNLLSYQQELQEFWAMEKQEDSND